MKTMVILLALLTGVALTTLVSAKEASLMGDSDRVVEARVMALSEELRCLVCQNQTLSGSESDFAKDIRREMRIMMKAGQSDEQVIAFLVERFGDFILFKPPVKGITWLLWFGPLLLLLFGATLLVVVLRRRQKVSETQPLSAVDHQRAEALLRGLSDQDEQTKDKMNEERKV